MTVESFIKGILVGSIAGAAIGLLFAPKSGNETRRQIRNSADQLRKKVIDTAEHQKQAYAETRDMLKKAVNAGVDTYKKGKEELRAH